MYKIRINKQLWFLQLFLNYVPQIIKHFEWLRITCDFNNIILSRYILIF